VDGLSRQEREKVMAHHGRKSHGLKKKKNCRNQKKATARTGLEALLERLEGALTMGHQVARVSERLSQMRGRKNKGIDKGEVGTL